MKALDLSYSTTEEFIDVLNNHLVQTNRNDHLFAKQSLDFPEITLHKSTLG